MALQVPDEAGAGGADEVIGMDGASDGVQAKHQVSGWHGERISITPSMVDNHFRQHDPTFKSKTIRTSTVLARLSLRICIIDEQFDTRAQRNAFACDSTSRKHINSAD